MKRIKFLLFIFFFFMMASPVFSIESENVKSAFLQDCIEPSAVSEISWYYGAYYPAITNDVSIISHFFGITGVPYNIDVHSYDFSDYSYLGFFLVDGINNNIYVSIAQNNIEDVTIVMVHDDIQRVYIQNNYLIPQPQCGIFLVDSESIQTFMQMINMDSSGNL